MKILLAEDDLNISTILSLSLEQLGNHTVVVAENGLIAINHLQTSQFDLILLDGMMPVMNGIEACRTIKENLKLNTPVIFLSARSDENARTEYLSLGACGFIEKPFDPSTICEQIEEILSEEKSFAC